MTLDVKSWQATADRAIRDWGQSGRLVSRRENLEMPVRFAWIEYNATELDGDIIRDTDRRAYMSTAGVTVEPQADDWLYDANGDRYRVVSPRPIAPTGVPLAYDMQVRR